MEHALLATSIRPSVTSWIHRLQEVLGSGEFGTVYKGTWHTGSEHSDEGLKKEAVAVKCLDDSNNEEAKVKFLQEAAIMAQFNHPNIIRIQGIVMDDKVCLYFSVNVAMCII